MFIYSKFLVKKNADSPLNSEIKLSHIPMAYIFSITIAQPASINARDSASVLKKHRFIIQSVAAQKKQLSEICCEGPCMHFCLHFIEITISSSSVALVSFVSTSLFVCSEKRLLIKCLSLLGRFSNRVKLV